MQEKLTESQQKIIEICDSIKDVLLYKNQKYGDSALKPTINCFYKGNATNSIAIRLDDKLNRIFNNKSGFRINDVCDLTGYLILLLISIGVNKKDLEKLKD